MYTHTNMLHYCYSEKVHIEVPWHHSKYMPGQLADKHKILLYELIYQHSRER